MYSKRLWSRNLSWNAFKRSMTFKHHIIPFHEWKKRVDHKATRSNRDYNASDNVVWLTAEQHAEVHKFLYELNGCEFDLIASKMIRGCLGKEQAIRSAQIHSNRTRTITQLHKDKQSKTMTGRSHTPETKAKITRESKRISASRKRDKKGMFLWKSPS